MQIKKYLTKRNLIALTLFSLLIYSCNNRESNKSESRKQIVEELPPLNVCHSEIGIVKMNADGETYGKVTELTELKKLLKKGNCDVIEIVYELKGTYGDNIAKKIVYDKKNKKLDDISTQNNVIESYGNVTEGALNAFLKKGERLLWVLPDYTKGKYDFNNREMTNKAVGSAPRQSSFDGSVLASSLEFIEWTKVTPSDEFWAVRCKFRGKNSFGQLVVQNQWFYIQNENVVKVGNNLETIQ
ncbi:MAG: hypothetical protein RL621_1444 [Bacteroidota bacterium]|jgi:hypothetical protein